MSLRANTKPAVPVAVAITALAVSSLFTACAGAKSSTGEAAPAPAPAWISSCAGAYESGGDVVFRAIGTADKWFKNRGGLGRTTARNRAQAELIPLIQMVVDSTTRDLPTSGTTAADPHPEEPYVEVNPMSPTAIASQALVKKCIETAYLAADGTQFVMLEVPGAAIVAAIAETRVLTKGQVERAQAAFPAAARGLMEEQQLRGEGRGGCSYGTSSH